MSQTSTIWSLEAKSLQINSKILKQNKGSQQSRNKKNPLSKSFCWGQKNCWGQICPTNGPSNFCPICWGWICVKPPNFFFHDVKVPPMSNHSSFPHDSHLGEAWKILIQGAYLPVSGSENPLWKVGFHPFQLTSPHILLLYIYILCIVSYYNIIEIHIRSVPFVFCETWWFPNHGVAGYMWKFKGLLLCEK